MVVLKRSCCFVPKQGSASAVGTVFCKQKEERADGEAISTLRDFRGLGFRASVAPVHGVCR